MTASPTGRARRRAMARLAVLAGFCLVAFVGSPSTAEAEIASIYASNEDREPRETFESHEALYATGTITNVIGIGGVVCVVPADRSVDGDCDGSAFGRPLTLFAGSSGLSFNVTVVQPPLPMGTYRLLADNPPGQENRLSEPFDVVCAGSCVRVTAVPTDVYDRYKAEARGMLLDAQITCGLSHFAYFSAAGYAGASTAFAMTFGGAVFGIGLSYGVVLGATAAGGVLGVLAARLVPGYQPADFAKDWFLRYTCRNIDPLKRRVADPRIRTTRPWLNPPTTRRWGSPIPRSRRPSRHSTISARSPRRR